jgi:tetratricopeptide (TPR) repeat protein
MATNKQRQTQQPATTPAATAAASAQAGTPPVELSDVEAAGNLTHFFKREDWWAAAATFLFSTWIFLRNMAPEVTLQDSGELVTGAFNLGVPHPPGYPLWALLGYIWSHVVVPFGNPAWRIGTMSVFTGGLTVGILTLMMTRSTRILLHTLPFSRSIEERLLHWIALTVGMSTALLFGFNRGVWLWASVSEMRVLNAFSFVLIACTFFAWVIQPQRKGYLYATLLIFGLSMTNHQTVGIMALALVAGTLAQGLDHFFQQREQLPEHSRPSGFAMMMTSLMTFWELSVAVLFSLSAVFLLFAWLHTQGALTNGIIAWRIVVVAGLAVAGVLGMLTGAIESWMRKLAALGVCVLLVALYLGVSNDPLLFKSAQALRPELLASWGLLAAGALLLGIGAELGWIRPRYAVLYTALFLAGCAFYLYMPIASATNPPMNWGYASTKEGFLHAITRGQYEKLLMADPFGSVFGIQIWIFVRGLLTQYSWPLCLFGVVTLLVATAWLLKRLIVDGKNMWIPIVWLALVPICMAGVTILRKVVLGLPIPSLLPPLLWGLSLATVLCMLIGSWLYLKWPGRSWMIFAWAAFFASSIGLIMVINPKLDRQEQEITIKFFAPAHGFYAMLIGYGIAMVFGFVLWLWRSIPRVLVQACCIALLALPYITYRENWSLCALGTHDFGYQFGYRMFCPGGGYPDMDKDAVLYGGTDPGRFVPTYMIFCESRVSPKDRFQSPHLSGDGKTFDRSDVYIITQNALADNTYMSYIRDHYDISRPTNNATMLQRALGRDHTYPRDPIRIPTPEDSTRAFQQFVEDWKAGKAPPGADLKIEGGRVQVTGVQAVMAINGILARWIFDWNKDKHAFYVEESYVIPWMYPYLRPAGVIMKIDKDPLPGPQQDRKLWDGIIAKDKAYWDNLTRDFTNREEFVRNNDAKKSFSKMRSAIAGLYLWRGLLPEAEYAFRQSLQLCPESPEGCFRLADLCMNQRRFDDARKIMEDYLKVDPYNGNVKSFLGQIDSLQKNDKRRVELQNKMATGADINDVMELLAIFGRMNMQPEMASLGQNILNNSNVPPVYLVRVAQLFTDVRRVDLAQDAYRRYLAREPKDSRAWIELGWTQLLQNQTVEALASWRKAVEIGGDAARALLRKDPRFQPLWQQRDLPQPFVQLIQPARPPPGLDLGL